MSVGDEKDENQKSLHGAMLKPGIFPGKQEQELQTILKGFGFANFQQSERFLQFLGKFYLGEAVEITCTLAGTEYPVTHHLKAVPQGHIIIKSPALRAGYVNASGTPGVHLYSGDTAWTSTTAYFWSDDDAATFTVWLWLDYTGR